MFENSLRQNAACRHFWDQTRGARGWGIDHVQEFVGAGKFHEFTRQKCELYMHV